MGDPCAAKFFADAAVRAILDHQENGLRDDGSIVLPEWRLSPARALTNEAVVRCGSGTMGVCLGR